MCRFMTHARRSVRVEIFLNLKPCISLDPNRGMSLHIDMHYYKKKVT